ncbi:DUF1064 domain-containing protein [Fructilactobacillus florum]|uniref:DUF1064 domain-containing protein n=1 Tax=Fructilactobacillus florum TaxID=640331 RepID=UPI0006D25C15|nr:DUF1064 domain-containing protein [Fructilactobacillus florum]
MTVNRQSISSWKRRTNQLQKSHNKYHAKKMTIDGIKFDSKAEAQYYRLYASNSQKKRINPREFCHS